MYWGVTCETSQNNKVHVGKLIKVKRSERQTNLFDCEDNFISSNLGTLELKVTTDSKLNSPFLLSQFTS